MEYIYAPKAINEIEKIVGDDYYISDMELFEKTISDYLKEINSTNIKYNEFGYADERNTDYYISQMFNNATLEDFKDPTSFLNRYINFMKDDLFANYNDAFVGTISDYEIMATRKEAFYNMETPFYFEFYLKKDDKQFYLPVIRYGISNNTVYIYSIQNQEFNQDEFNNNIREKLKKINSGVKKHRNISPSFLISLTIFFKIIETIGIKRVHVPFGLIKRELARKKSLQYEEYELKRINDNINRKFLLNFIRLASHFDHLNIIGSTNSYLSLDVGQVNYCNNPFLAQIYDIDKYSNNKTI